MSDGCQGVVDAWRLMQSNHSPRGGPQSPRADPKPEWLAFARKYGDFLVANQAMDGSIAGESLGWTLLFTFEYIIYYTRTEVV